MPTSALNNLEFLALQMKRNPGQSGRFYLGKLHQYRFPKAHKTNPKSNFGASYLTPGGKYFGKLWVDNAKCEVDYFSCVARGKRPASDTIAPGWYRRPKVSCWSLTKSGELYASRAEVKLGLTAASEVPALHVHVSKKQQLLNWWKSQPEFKATRVDLCRQYEIISGWRDENGKLIGSRWPSNPVHYTSLTVGPIAESCGFRDNLKVTNPRSGRLVMVYNLDFNLRA